MILSGYQVSHRIKKPQFKAYSFQFVILTFNVVDLLHVIDRALFSSPLRDADLHQVFSASTFDRFFSSASLILFKTIASKSSSLP